MLAAEGRALWGALVRYSRDWVRLSAAHFQGELRGRAARYVQVRPCCALAWPRCVLISAGALAWLLLFLLPQKAVLLLLLPWLLF